ncbi:uncharacterized protein LOC141657619 [Silene latifolia]|uniref:uncharacterized protein LOC141657619 n=1 Tax=Silene latifolia TaxID=37657 RepID=UPI003D773496
MDGIQVQNLPTNNSSPALNQSHQNTNATNSNIRVPVDISSLPDDPAERIPILKYHVDDMASVRRAYLQNKTIQPREHSFPYTNFSGINRCFKAKWFDQYRNWLEYNIKQDAAFCLCCYLLKTETIGHGGGDTFNTKGFKAWNKTDRFRVHVGGPNSAHNKAVKMCEDLMNEKQLLLSQRLAFRGHNEHESSRNRGNFLEVLEWYSARVDKATQVALRNAPKNLKMTCPQIQKQIVNSCAMETIKAITEDLNGDYFSILVDESKGKSHKEQMAIVLRYVDKRGMIMEHLLVLFVYAILMLCHLKKQ